MKIENLYEKFQNPGNAYRGKPFWAWNGELEIGELKRQADVFQKMGFGGYFMHSRTGLATEYLGKDWFRLINEVADYAQEQGMEAWLYDEDRWPSGSAGGLATQDVRYRMKYMQLSVVPAGDFRWQDNTLAAFTGKVEGVKVYDAKPLLKDQRPEGTVLHFTREIMPEHPVYNGNAYVDTLMPEAVAHFLELTHERYARECGVRLGDSIKGIFTDEPHRGALMDIFGSTQAIEQGNWRMPYTDGLFERYEREYGDDLRAHLPELFLLNEGQTVSQVKWRYVDLVERMFLEAYAIPMHECCQKHHLYFTGHVLQEDTLSGQTAMIGSVMRFYEHMDVPGVDVLTEGNKNFLLVKQLSSVARQTGKAWKLSELYGCTGWQFSLENHKQVGDWQALLGIDVRCPHLSWYTMQGEAKRDYPASIFFQSAWWKDYKQVEDYFARMHVLLHQGEQVSDTLVVHPIESVWCSVFPGWSRNLAGTTDQELKLEKHFADLFDYLQGEQIDFDYGDEEMMSRLCAIERENGRPVLRLGHARYRRVVVSGLTTIRSTTLNLLREFARQGGRVILAGEKPGYVDALAGDASIQGALEIPFEPQALKQALSEARRIELSPSCPEVLATLRESEAGVALVLVNTNRERGVDRLKIRVKAQGYPQEWLLKSGGRAQPIYRRQGEWVEIETSLTPGGERAYLMAQAPLGANPRPLDPQPCRVVPISGEFAYRLTEPNALALDFARWRVDDGAWQEADEVLKVDRKARAMLGLAPRGGDMLQPWFIAQRPKEVKGKVALRFGFYVERLPDDPVELAMEEKDAFEVSVNGVPMDKRARGWWVDPCYSRLAIPQGVLKPGENVVEIETGYHAGSNLEAMYLLGNFGVRTESDGRVVMTGLPRRLALGDLRSQGLPFYGGGVELTVPVEGALETGETALLRLNGLGGCAAVRVEDAETICWAPYTARVESLIREHGAVRLTLLLTRRNTFGPLHMLPERIPGYGPDCFLTEGEHFTRAYATLPNGLEQGARIEIYKED